MFWSGTQIYIVNPDRRFRCCCCNQRRLTGLLSSIANADAPAITADLSTVVVVDAADPELCQSADRSGSLIVDATD